MLPLIGAIVGLFSGALPEAMKYFKQKQDNAHELKVMELQIQAQAQAHTERLEEINTQADIADSQALYKAAEQKITGVRWADAAITLLISSVRPIITYAFFGLYAAVKLSMYQGSMAELWTEMDMAVFSTIIAHWFGYRSMQHFSGKGRK